MLLKMIRDFIGNVVKFPMKPERPDSIAVANATIGALWDQLQVPGALFPVINGFRVLAIIPEAGMLFRLVPGEDSTEATAGTGYIIVGDNGRGAVTGVVQDPMTATGWNWGHYFDDPDPRVRRSKAFMDALERSLMFRPGVASPGTMRKFLQEVQRVM